MDQIDRWSVIAQPDADYREIPQIMPAPWEVYGLDFGVGGKQKGNDELRWIDGEEARSCLLYTSPSPRDRTRSRMPSSA